MTYPIKLFTLHGELRGKQLWYGKTFLPLVNVGPYKSGDKGYFVVMNIGRGFSVLNCIRDSNLPVDK